MNEMKSRLIFGACAIISGITAMFGMNALPVMAAEDVGADVGADAGISIDDSTDTARELSENSQVWVNKSGNTAGDEDVGVYDFKDNKTNGTFTVTKEWSDKRTNEERPEPEIKVSAKKPSKSTLGYTVTFHGNKDAGLVFDDGSDVNNVVYNGSWQIVSGIYKIFDGVNIAWYLDKDCTQKVDINDGGDINMNLSEDLDIYGKVLTFDIKGYGYVKEKNGYVNQFKKISGNSR